MRPYLELIRLPAVFTAPSDVLLGVSLAIASGAAPSIGIIGLLVFASLCAYASGMACNDIFDADVDLQERPARPIPSGRVSKRSALLFVFVLQGLGIVIALFVGVYPAMTVAGVMALTYLYNGWAKKYWLGPIVMGSCRYGNALIGLSIVVDYQTTILLVPGFIWLYVIGLTTVSRFEVLGIDSVAGRVAVFLFCGSAIGGIFLPFIFENETRLEVSFLGLIPFLWLAPTAVRLLRSAGRGHEVRSLVMRGIEGIAVYNGVLAFCFGGVTLGLSALLLILPGRWVGRWFYST